MLTGSPGFLGARLSSFERGENRSGGKKVFNRQNKDKKVLGGS